MSIKLTILGPGTAVPVPDRRPSAYLVQTGNVNILMDAGPGAVHTLAHHDVYPQNLDVVLLSHFHPDHCLDIITLLFALHNPQVGSLRQKPLYILGPPGTIQWKAGLEDMYGDWVIPECEIICREYEDLKNVAGVEIKAFPVKHDAESHAIRIRSNSSTLAYSGDSEPCEGLVKAARESDLFLCECSFPESPKQGGHMDPVKIGETALKAGVKKILLTHLYPQVLESNPVDSCREIFSGPVEIARQGALYEI